jgi:hypothetical protein
MLDGADANPRVVAKHRTQRQILDEANIRWDVGNDAAALGDEKPVADVGTGRVQHHRGWRTAVDPLALQFDFTGNSCLSRANESLRHLRRPSSPRQPRRPSAPCLPSPGVAFHSDATRPIVRGGLESA